MRKSEARYLSAAALLSLLCAAAGACTLPRLPGGGRRDAGGIYLVLAVRADPAQVRQSVAQTMQVVATRCEYVGVECRFEQQGGADSDRVKLRVAGAQDFARVKSVLLAEGRLELRPIVSPPSPFPLQFYRTRQEAEAAAHADGHDVVPYEEPGTSTVFLAVEREPVVSGADISDARAVAGMAAAVPGGQDHYSIHFTLRPEAAARFGAWTGANVNRYLAIVLNGWARSAPYIRGTITDTGQITGDFTKEQAEDVALTLRSGSLPARLEVLEEGTYKP